MTERKAVEGLMCTCEVSQKWGDRYASGDFIHNNCECTVYDAQLWQLVKLMDLKFKFVTINATEKVKNLFNYKGETNENSNELNPASPLYNRELKKAFKKDFENAPKYTIDEELERAKAREKHRRAIRKICPECDSKMNEVERGHVYRCSKKGCNFTFFE